MNSNKFPWGKVVSTHSYNFDGKIFEVTKYIRSEHLRLSSDAEFQYHCEELHQSTNSFEELLIAWIAHKNLGLNQWALVAGICKALNIK